MADLKCGQLTRRGEPCKLARTSGAETCARHAARMTRENMAVQALGDIPEAIYMFESALSEYLADYEIAQLDAADQIELVKHIDFTRRTQADPKWRRFFVRGRYSYLSGRYDPDLLAETALENRIPEAHDFAARFTPEYAKIGLREAIARLDDYAPHFLKQHPGAEAHLTKLRAASATLRDLLQEMTARAVRVSEQDQILVNAGYIPDDADDQINCSICGAAYENYGLLVSDPEAAHSETLAYVADDTAPPCPDCANVTSTRAAPCPVCGRLITPRVSQAPQVWEMYYRLRVSVRHLIGAPLEWIAPRVYFGLGAVGAAAIDFLGDYVMRNGLVYTRGALRDLGADGFILETRRADGRGGSTLGPIVSVSFASADAEAADHAAIRDRCVYVAEADLTEAARVTIADLGFRVYTFQAWTLADAADFAIRDMARHASGFYGSVRVYSSGPCTRLETSAYVGLISRLCAVSSLSIGIAQ